MVNQELEEVFCLLLITSCFSVMNVVAGVPTVFLAYETKLHAKDIKENRYWVPNAHGVAITIYLDHLSVDFMKKKKKQTNNKRNPAYSIFQPLFFVFHGIKSQTESWNQGEKWAISTYSFWSFNYSKIYIRQASKARLHARNSVCNRKHLNSLYSFTRQTCTLTDVFYFILVFNRKKLSVPYWIQY